MTNKEAIQEIINLANSLQIIQSTPTGQAVLMAIKSLEAWEKVKEEMDNCNDYYELGSMVLKHLKEVENEADN